jgi:hypothetical protein
VAARRPPTRRPLTTAALDPPGRAAAHPFTGWDLSWPITRLVPEPLVDPDGVAEAMPTAGKGVSLGRSDLQAVQGLADPLGDADRVKAQLGQQHLALAVGKELVGDAQPQQRRVHLLVGQDLGNG